ncbi:MAG: type II secretion system F family protein [Clostridiales bacterium]|nr:type II secretion system F family protein [Clostridiales bacterium]
MQNADIFEKGAALFGGKEKNKNEEIRALSRKTYLIFMSKCLPILPLCIAIVYLLSSPFLADSRLQLVISIPLGIFPFISCVRVLYGKRTTTLRAQNKVLMQSLCTSVSDGYSIERAFLCARVDIEKAFGKRAAFAHALKDVEHRLQAHESLDSCMTHFCHMLDYYETLPILHALSLQKTVGNQIISILRSSCQMLSELHSVQSEVEANNSGKNTEALLLCMMPFGITYLLSMTSGEYLHQAQGTGLGKLLMAVAFTIAVFSCTYLFSLIGEKPSKNRFNYLTDSENIPEKYKRKIHKIGLSLPSMYTTRVLEWCSEISFSTMDAFDGFIFKVISRLLICTPLFLLICFLLRIPILLVVFMDAFILVLLHVDQQSIMNKRRLILMEDLPLFISMLSTLLESGILLPKALSTCGYAFAEQSCLSQELKHMLSKIEGGVSAADALETFSHRISIPEAQSALLLAARYERSGGNEVLGLLRLQASSCWALCRNASRKKREREAFNMILPMMLDFVSVLIVSIAPALNTFQML